MAGYWIDGYGICSREYYYAHINEKENKVMDGNDVISAMNGTNNVEKETNTMEENNVMMNMNDLVKTADKEVDAVLKGKEIRLEGQGLKDIFGDSAEIEKLAIQYKSGTTASDNETYGVILFKKKDTDGNNYFTFVSGKVRDKIQVMINAAGGESQLNYIIKQQGLKARFGNKVVTSDDGLHTNVKIWFEA